MSLNSSKLIQKKKSHDVIHPNNIKNNTLYISKDILSEQNKINSDPKPYKPLSNELRNKSCSKENLKSNSTQIQNNNKLYDPMECYRDYDCAQKIREDILQNEKFPFIFYDSNLRNLVIYYKDNYTTEIKTKYFSAQRFGHATAKKIALNFLRSLGVNADYLENNNVFSYERDTKSKLFNIGKAKANINPEEKFRYQFNI